LNDPSLSHIDMDQKGEPGIKRTLTWMGRAQSARAAHSWRTLWHFNNVGPLTFLAPGQSAFWSYSYGGDHGTQFASADVKTPNLGAVHLADQQRKQKLNNGNTNYFVAIHNQGVGWLLPQSARRGDVMKMTIVTDRAGNMCSAPCRAIP
jgi:hypothetical protein